MQSEPKAFATFEAQREIIIFKSICGNAFGIHAFIKRPAVELDVGNHLEIH